MSTTLDVTEATRYLRVHPGTIYRLAAAGELPGAKMGRAWVFIQDDLLAWLEA